jgi:HEPN domain-containing protein
MSELVREWVEKAEGDVRTAEREVRVKEGANWDAVCFHAQQAAEKYLKAALQQKGIAFSRTHDLAALLVLLPGEWSQFQDDVEWLSAFAVEVRYPGEIATEESATKAVEIMRRVRAHLRPLLGLDPPT